jgi:hypothetical protein
MKHNAAPALHTHQEYFMRRNPFAFFTLLALLVTGFEAHAVCTAGNPNANMIESTPTSAFTDNGDGTVTHHLTGLMWKQCAEGASGADCATGVLVPGITTFFTWDAALIQAKNANFAGWTDWRLPNLKELDSIVETCGNSLAINRVMFPGNPVSYIWSSNSAGTTNAWMLDFVDGYTFTAPKTDTHFVRLVRGGQPFDTFDAQGNFTPNSFSFTARTGIALSTIITSNTITVAGITTVSAISITGGTYSINGGTYTAAAGPVNNGDTVTVQQTSSASFSTPTTATLTIGGISGAFAVTTLAADTTPDAFVFADQTGVALSTLITSAPLQITGINATTNWTAVGGMACVSSGIGCACDVAGYAASGAILNNQYLCARHTSSGAFSVATDTLITVGGVSDTFTSTTSAIDTIPNAFAFTPQTGVALSTLTTSNAIAISGINAATPISIVGGTYTINGGTYTSAAGSVNNNDTVTVRQTSSASYSTLTAATLTIGGVSGMFSVTTAPPPGVPGAPVIGTATPGNTQATISFSPPASNGGSAITTYTATCGAFSASGAASPLTVAGLSNGTAYLCSVTAANAAGTGLASATVSVTPFAAPVCFAAPSATGSGTINACFTGSGPACAYAVSQYIPLAGNAASPPAGSAPAGVTFPHRLFDFTTGGCTPGSTITMTITYPQALPPGTQYWKYGPTPANAAPHWYVLPATIAGNTATFSITDGGLGDDDLTANGAIVDQGGPGVPGAAGAAGIPTLSEWGTILLSFLLAGAASLALRRQGRQ